MGAKSFISRIFSRNNASGISGVSNSSKKSADEMINGLITSIRNKMFPEGQKQIDEISIRLANELSLPVDKTKSLLMYSCTKVFLGNSDKEMIIYGVLHHYDCQVNRKQAESIVREAYVRMAYSFDPSGNSISQTLACLGFVEGNTVDDYYQMVGAYGKYGLSVTNPIPTCGIPANVIYLSSLKTDDGQAISWNRIGSMSTDNIDNLIDAYNITDSRGNDRGVIYLCAYNSVTSKRAPEGFVLI